MLTQTRNSMQRLWQHEASIKVSLMSWLGLRGQSTSCSQGSKKSWGSYAHGIVQAISAFSGSPFWVCFVFCRISPTGSQYRTTPKSRPKIQRVGMGGTWQVIFHFLKLRYGPLIWALGPLRGILGTPKVTCKVYNKYIKIPA